MKFEIDIPDLQEAEKFRRNLRFGGIVYTLRKDGTKYEEHRVDKLKEVLGEQVTRVDSGT